MVNCFFNLLFLFKKKTYNRELVNNMRTPYYQFSLKVFRKIFQTNNTMIAISKKLQELCKTYKVKNIGCAKSY